MPCRWRTQLAAAFHGKGSPSLHALPSPPPPPHYFLWRLERAMLFLEAKLRVRRNAWVGWVGTDTREVLLAGLPPQLSPASGHRAGFVCCSAWREARTRTAPELRGKCSSLGPGALLGCGVPRGPVLVYHVEAAAGRLAGVRRPRCSLRLPPAQHLPTGASLVQDEVPICLLLLPAPPQGHSAGPLSARLPFLHSPLRCPSH